MSAHLNAEKAARTYEGNVHGVDCDLQGHLNTARYAAVFDAASWRLYGLLGYRWSSEAQIGWADVKSIITYHREVIVDSRITVRSMVFHLGTKSMTVFHELFVNDEHKPAASFELIVVQFDLKARRATEILAEYRHRAQEYLQTPSAC